MKGVWIEIDEARSNYPKQEGKYLVRFHTGSIAPKVIERQASFTPSGNNKPRFQGEFDWDYATHWRET